MACNGNRDRWSIPPVAMAAPASLQVSVCVPSFTMSALLSHDTLGVFLLKPATVETLSFAPTPERLVS